MKKIILGLFAISALAFGMSSCQEQPNSDELVGTVWVAVQGDEEEEIVTTISFISLESCTLDNSLYGKKTLPYKYQPNTVRITNPENNVVLTGKVNENTISFTSNGGTPFIATKQK